MYFTYDRTLEVKKHFLMPNIIKSIGSYVMVDLLF